MPDTTELRKTLIDPTPFYFAAGVIEKVRTEAPERFAKVRTADPKAVQDKVQERFQGVLSTLDTDIKKLREQAQHYALQGVGFAAEAAVKAKESYDSLAEQGKVAVENWRGKDEAGEITYTATIEREPVTVAPEPESPAEAGAEPKKAAPRRTTTKKTSTRKTASKSES
jgi:hypothetical protein